MNLALYEVTLSGHHGTYLTVVAKEAVKRRWRVSAIVPRPEATHPAFEVLQQVIGSDNVMLTDQWVAPLKAATPFSLVGHHLSQHRAASRSFRKCARQWDFVYTSNLDYMDKAIQAFGAPSYPVPMGGMCMRARFHMKGSGISSENSSIRSSLERIVFQRLLRARGMSCVTTADPTLAEYSDAQKAGEFAKVKYVPEIGMCLPRMGKAEARSRFGLTHDDRVILVYGAVSERKGIRDLLNAIATQARDMRLKILVVGQADSETESFLRLATSSDLDHSKLVATHLAFADQDTEEAAFAASDAVWVAYRHHSTMSGVFYQAVCCGIPVITADYGILPSLAQRYSVGISVNLDNPHATGDQIANLFADSRKYADYRRHAEEIREPHLPGNFGRAICDVIHESLSSDWKTLSN